jgi:hypothetical protein
MFERLSIHVHTRWNVQGVSMRHECTEPGLRMDYVTLHKHRRLNL